MYVYNEDIDIIFLFFLKFSVLCNISLIIEKFFVDKIFEYIISDSLLLSSYFVKYFKLFLFEVYLFTYDSISSK